MEGVKEKECEKILVKSGLRGIPPGSDLGSEGYSFIKFQIEKG